jgi:hypothetical protein
MYIVHILHSEFIRKNNFGWQIGLGGAEKIIQFETKLDVSLFPFFDLNNGQGALYVNLFLSLNVNIERIINNKKLTN